MTDRYVFTITLIGELYDKSHLKDALDDVRQFTEEACETIDHFEGCQVVDVQVRGMRKKNGRK